MKNLHTLKKRIVSVKMTKKITNALKLISYSKNNKLKQHFTSIKQRSENMYKIINNFYSFTSLLKEKKDDKKVIWILIGSKSGLCGTYNRDIISLFKKNYKVGDEIICFGEKIKTEFKKNNFGGEIKYLFNIYEEKEINYVLEAICEYLYEYIKKYNSWNVKLVYNKIVKAASFKSEIIDIFDFDKYFQNEKKNVYTNLNDKGKEVKIIKNKKELCEQIIKMYFKTIINAAVNESIYNENLSRLYSMSNACDSAQDMLNDLVVSYNKVRHDHITKQISEIISSFEAGKTYE